jgi:AcrR family transcriptional regulator
LATQDKNHNLDQEDRGRPGGRTAQTSDRIADAVVALLVERGADECTFTNVAALADVERSTLYRRYSSRWDMIGQSLFVHQELDLAVDATGDFRADMTAHLRKIAKSLESTQGRAMVVAGAMARVDRVPEGGRYWRQRREQLQPIIDAAAASGQTRAGIDADELFAAADGPLFFRMLVGNAPLDETVITQVVDNLCRLYVSSGDADGRSRAAEKETAS